MCQVTFVELFTLPFISYIFGFCPGFLSLQEETNTDPQISSELHQATELLHQHGMGHLTEEWFMQELRRMLQRETVPQFWHHFEPAVTAESTESNIAAFTSAVNQLHGELASKMQSAKILESLSEQFRHQNVAKAKRMCITERVKTLIKAILFSRVPKSFYEHVKEFYSQAFKVKWLKSIIRFKLG